MNFIDNNIESYAISKSTLPSLACKELEERTREVENMSMMLVGELEASLLGFLIKSINAKRVLEIGTFTGYSALAMAEVLPKEGILFTCDVEERPYTKEFWSKSVHGEKIQFLLGKALETIPTIEGEFDLVFIDADKENYLNYLEMVLPRISSNGIVVLDNMLWSGNVLKENSELPVEDKSTPILKQVNEFIANHSNLYGTLLPVRDGIFLVKKS